MYIVVDFDGTCVTHSYPLMGQDIGAAPILHQLIEHGHKLILFTMRSDGCEEKVLESGSQIYAGNFLEQAVDWFGRNNLSLYGIQTNPTQHRWTTSPKAYGQLIIDDAALGCPLIYPGDAFHHPGVVSDRPYVNWFLVEEFLIEKGII